VHAQLLLDCGHRLPDLFALCSEAGERHFQQLIVDLSSHQISR
jgi:hypothetical protein